MVEFHVNRDSLIPFQKFEKNFLLLALEEATISTIANITIKTGGTLLIWAMPKFLVDSYLYGLCQNFFHHTMDVSLLFAMNIWYI